MSGSHVVAAPKTSEAIPYTAERLLTLGRTSFKRSDDGTELMNVDGQAAGAAAVLWNGTGAGDTGGDWTRLGIGSESAASKKTGTNGLDTGVALLNDQVIFDNGSMIDVDSLYSALEFDFQPKAYPTGSNLRLRWVDASNNQVGGQVNLHDQVPNMDTDVWQRVSISIDDFGLTGNAQKLQLRCRAAAGQHFWFDDFDLIATTGAGPYRFVVAAPDASTVYHLSMAVLLVSAPETGWDLSSFANISSGLARGLIMRHRRISTLDVLWNFTTKSNAQLFGQFHPQESFVFNDSNLLVGFMVKPGKADVQITNDDVLEFVVRDDLSTINEMRAYCHYGVEVLV